MCVFLPYIVPWSADLLLEAFKKQTRLKEAAIDSSVGFCSELLFG